MSKNVLIIDDDPDMVLFLSLVLKDHGYCTIEASNGFIGLEKARSGHPDLILLDLMMPKKSGISLLSDLKSDDVLKKIPVIMVTGVSGETGIDIKDFFKKGLTGDREGETQGPEGYLEKPVDPEELLEMIEKAFV